MTTYGTGTYGSGTYGGTEATPPPVFADRPQIGPPTPLQPFHPPETPRFF